MVIIAGLMNFILVIHHNIVKKWMSELNIIYVNTHMDLFISDHFNSTYLLYVIMNIMSILIIYKR